MTHEKIIILDFGSHTTTYCRRVRELNIYCEIHPFNKIPSLNKDVKSVILSGSPFSVRDENCPIPNLDDIKGKIPIFRYVIVLNIGKINGGEVCLKD